MKVLSKAPMRIVSLRLPLPARAHGNHFVLARLPSQARSTPWFFFYPTHSVLQELEGWKLHYDDRIETRPAVARPPLPS